MWRGVYVLSVLVTYTTAIGLDCDTSAFGRYRNAAVSTDTEVCSTVGRQIMENLGGNTVDGSVAAAFCEGVVQLQFMGVGGGNMITFYDGARDKIWALIGREVAPLAATAEMFINCTGCSLVGGLSIGVPGEVASYGALHKQYGSLPWSKLLAPSIKLCEEGFKVGPSLSSLIQKFESQIRQHPEISALLIKPDNTRVTEGDLLKRPKLAATLRHIADNGPDSFYTGKLAEDIVADIQDAGGIITLDDLKQYKAQWVEPVSLRLSNGDVMYGPPPPSSASVLFHIVRVMDSFKYKSFTQVDDIQDKALFLHRFIEAQKFGYGKRSSLGDDMFFDNSEILKKLLSEDYAKVVSKKIKDDSVLPFADYDSDFIIAADQGTSHLSVAGSDGCAVSITSTINAGFGSLVRGSRTGIIFNDQMDDFSTPGLVNNFGFQPSPSNFIAPGKRPMSSTSPTVILDSNGNFKLALGSSGGARIISSISEVLYSNRLLRDPINLAIDRKRFHNQLLPNSTQYEAGFAPDDVQALLKEKGQTLVLRTGEIGVIQAVEMSCRRPKANKPCLTAVSDYRRCGVPDGF